MMLQNHILLSWVSRDPNSTSQTNSLEWLAIHYCIDLLLFMYKATSVQTLFSPPDVYVSLIKVLFTAPVSLPTALSTKKTKTCF